MLSRYTFDFAFRLFIIILPFITVLGIFTKERLGIPGFSFLKELLVISMLSTVAIYHLTKKHRIEWTRYDTAIGLYVLTLLIISFFTTGVDGVVYGGRYDFAFLIVFFTIYHGYFLLSRPPSYYLWLFLASAGAMLLISMLLKWPLSEDLLLYLGYSGNPSNWQFGSSIPIFHGVDGANVRRFQGLLDGPNTMGAFLLLFTGIFLYYFRNKKDWYFVIGMGVMILVALVIYTYSRSALLGLLSAGGVSLLFFLREIFRKYRKEFFAILVIGIFLIAGLFFQYAGNLQAIIQRGGSTNGHLERMEMGLDRFVEHPLGQGLGSAGPAYRYVENLENMERKEIEELDRFSIPESWYIQQLIEGGIFGFIFFMLFIFLVMRGLFRIHIFLFATFLSICVMNFFLHTFESQVVSMLLFSLVALILASHRKKSWK